jgi:hypothetical protein
VAKFTASKSRHGTGSTGSWNQHRRNAVHVTGIATYIVGDWNVNRRQSRDSLGCDTIKGTGYHVDTMATTAIASYATVAKRSVRKASPIGRIGRDVTGFTSKRAHRYVICRRCLDREVFGRTRIQRSICFTMTLGAIPSR